MRVLEAYVVFMPWHHRSLWQQRLRNKVGRPWLEDDEVRRKDMLRWLNWADPGSCWHRDEDLWLVFETRSADTVLLANYIDQQLEALKIMYGPVLDLSAMD